MLAPVHCRRLSALMIALGAVAALAMIMSVPESGMRLSHAALLRRAAQPDRSLLTFLIPNLAVALVIASGRVLGGIPAVLLLVKFGYDAASFVAGGMASLPPAVLAAAVLPHGVFELPGFWLCGATGLGGLVLWKHLLVDDSAPVFGTAVDVGALVAGLALIVAGAAVEHWVTGSLLMRMGGVP
jgi:uncharacterized membrane protein SpoIIM required for sporulation